MVAPGQGISVVKVLPIEGVCPSMDSMVKGCSKGRIKEGGKIVLRGLWIGYQIFMSFIYIYIWVKPQYCYKVGWGKIF